MSAALQNINESLPSLRVLDIVGGTAVDGPGLRTSIYFAGCRHACPGCHNPQSWDMHGGHPLSVGQIMTEVSENDFNVTFSGGDPLYQPLEALLALAQAIRAQGYTLWLYTGFTYDRLLEIADGAPDCEGIDRPDLIRQLLALCQTVVEGPYIAEKRDLSLLFRGSSNQRLICPDSYASDITGSLENTGRPDCSGQP